MCHANPSLRSLAMLYLSKASLIAFSSRYEVLLPQCASGRMPRLVAPSDSIAVRRVSLTQPHTRHRISRPILVILNARIPDMQPTSTAALDRMSPPIDLLKYACRKHAAFPLSGQSPPIPADQIHPPLGYPETRRVSGPYFPTTPPRETRPVSRHATVHAIPVDLAIEGRRRPYFRFLSLLLLPILPLCFATSLFISEYSWRNMNYCLLFSFRPPSIFPFPLPSPPPLLFPYFFLILLSFFIILPNFHIAFSNYTY